MRISDDSLSRCGHLISTYLECVDDLDRFRRSIYDSEPLHDRTLGKETIRVLNQYQNDRSLGAYCLIVNGLVWDSEIVIRTVYETCAKILFLAASKAERREFLASEFWAELGAIYDRKGAEKASLAERLVRQFDENEARIFQGLKNPDLFEIDPTANKRRRNEIEQRWSFSEIIRTLSQTSEDHERVVGLDALSHMYGMMSHLAHASPKALDLMEDRATRGEDLAVLECTHVSRMLSDLTSLAGFSLRFSHVAEFGKISQTDPLNDVIQRMHVAGEDIRLEFDASQDDLYQRIAPQ